MKKHTIHGGMLEPVITTKNYVLGDQNTPQVVLEPNGDWSDSLPITESQLRHGIDSFNCTAEAITTQIEEYERKAFGEEKNYSARFLGVMAGTKPPGNDPEKVFEAIRKFGLIPEEMMPFDESITSAEEYFSWKGVDKEACLAKGKEWLATHDFYHELVPENVGAMKLALTFSPLAVGVYAWAKNEKGQYVRLGRDGHLTTCYEIPKEYEIFDTYEPYLKTLVEDFGFSYVKRIHLELKKNGATKVNGLNWTTDLLSRLLVFCKSLLTLDLQVLQQLPVSAPSAVEPIPEPTKQKRLLQAVKSWIGKDASPENRAPQELSCAEGVSRILHNLFPSFPKGIVSSKELDNELARSTLFRRTSFPKSATVIVSPRTAQMNGHAGFTIEDDKIVSNDSKTGLMAQNYTISSWIKKFKEGRGLELHLYELV